MGYSHFMHLTVKGRRTFAALHPVLWTTQGRKGPPTITMSGEWGHELDWVQACQTFKLGVG